MDYSGQEDSSDLRNSFKLRVQKPPPPQIQSVRLFRKGSANNPPVITLNSSQKLILEFDHLVNSSNQFRVEVSHRNKDWTRSPLPPNFYLENFFEVYFSNGLRSFSQRPSFYHYEFEFPNSQLSFKVSGNYLLSVYDHSSDKMLFSLPFFVTEDKGRLSTDITRLFAQRKDLRPQDQLFSRYEFPPLVELPQFDLSFYYAQNRFWGRTREATFFDTATPGEVNFHIGREASFIANFEFNLLNLSTFNIDGRQLLEIQKELIPPKIILRRDVESLDPVPRMFPSSRFGLPIDDRGASYANVLFRLETAADLSEIDKIYLVGDFNQWMITKENRMQYNAEKKIWEGKAFIKQGEYAYKYVIVNNDGVDELTLDQSFSRVPQEYITFVYFDDPSHNFDRLLKAEVTNSK